ncbi:hypothetical protein FH972_000749 [Carpinus fangiana]|uniref:Uncharacterized protein n=1 Tax=Carpinus fangiana TaxID=176857 RepID=A0A5N6QCQ5_9ROSI|nr:hypothetical protein FH972_000749 [Carpinus fangiana]
MTLLNDRLRSILGSTALYYPYPSGDDPFLRKSPSTAPCQLPMKIEQSAKFGPIGRVLRSLRWSFIGLVVLDEAMERNDYPCI